MTTHERLAQECLATADAIRHCRIAINRLIAEEPTQLPRLFPECSVVYVSGVDVAKAMESLAGRLGSTPPK